MPYKTIKLRSGKAGRRSPGHPWVYKNQFLKPDPAIKPGNTISLLDSDGKFIGNGYFNPHSEISIRLLTFNDELIDKNFIVGRIKEALREREKLKPKTNAYRAVFSEADGLAGLIVDRYADTVVFQVLTLGMERLKEFVLAGIKDFMKPRYIYEKSVSPFRKVEGLRDKTQWWGDTGKNIVEISEGPAKFLVDIFKGHKTGFYLDQRVSRMAMGNISKGKRVLDLFCYTGGFSVNAAINGAVDVTGVDIKREWLELAEKNTALNNVSEKVNFIEGDSFAVLKDMCASGDKFDIIIIDPPSFIRSKKDLHSASKGYKELNVLAMKSLNDKGVLATFSCSHHMPNEVFSHIIKDAAREARKEIMILKRCHQAEDHPIVSGLPETEYLKGYFLRVQNLRS